ncbi:MAG: Ribosome modulation factor [Candidatus Celerinatantimonas neptuna]|nr:MAG: Ribosome modulation factor [Candidatus Celerinatantimonas neptuna]
MKRQKRDRLERARAKGYQAGLSGRSKETCPYVGADARGYWFGGWRDASEERSGGMLTN